MADFAPEQLSQIEDCLAFKRARRRYRRVSNATICRVV